MSFISAILNYWTRSSIVSISRNLKIKGVFYLFILLHGLCYGQEKLNFIHLNRTFNGDSQVVEDHFGYIWISSIDGIYRYDGYDFSFIPYSGIFKNGFTNDIKYLLVKDNSDSFWLSSFHGELIKIDKNEKYTSFKDKFSNIKEPVKIRAIYPYQEQVWFGSSKGEIFVYENLDFLINHVISLPKINNVFQKITSISFTSSDSMWISTSSGLIYHYNITTKVLNKLEEPINGHPQHIELCADKKGRLWIATEWQGLYCYDTQEKIFKQYQEKENSTTQSKFDMFISIFCDSAGVVWAGTDGDGLYRINPENDEVTVFKHEENNKFSISNNTITNISEDSNRNIWITVKKGEINILPANKNKIDYYNGLESNTPTRVLSILKSSDGSLWTGTDGNGINRTFHDHTKVQYSPLKDGNYFFKGRYIHSLIEDAAKNIWIATYQNGLWVFMAKSKTFVKAKTLDSSGRYSSDIRFLFKDSKQRIWATSGVAIHVFSDDQTLLATYDYNTHGLNGMISQSICEDELGTVWIGMNDGGLYEFKENELDLARSNFVKHDYFDNKNKDFYNRDIRSLLPDFKGNLWILCDSGFLIRFHLKEKTYTSFLNNDNFKDIDITAILMEDPDNIWMSSAQGVHHYEVKKDALKSYYQIDGFQSNTFLRKSSFRDENGVFYFGGEYGMNAFIPKQLDKKETSARLYVNTIEILNKPAHLIIADQLTEGVENVNSLVLTANQSSFSFQFSAIDNILNSNYYYAYRLRGFDQNWVIPKKERIATYTNIPYGNYVLEIKAGSKKGEWDIAPKTIDIHIKPPWWHTRTAYSIYAIITFFIGFGVLLWLRLKSKLAREAWHNHKEKELYATKMNFFAKMSHEIQTPLTLILGPIDDMLDRAGVGGNGLLWQRLLMIKNNANRLSRIANELLIVRNKELGRLRILASKNDIVASIKDIAQSFTEHARFKKIDFVQEYPMQSVQIWYDRDKLEHIIYNLLSNAFKFTPREGEIVLKVNHCSIQQCVEILIKDSGPGIANEELEDIFKLFYQAKLGKHIKGSGIGLALTKELVSLHHGQISVTSSSEEGTCFTVRLCTKDEVFSEEEKIYEDSISNIPEAIEGHKVFEKRVGAQRKSLPLKQYTLLIVEDNIEMQMFLLDVLSKEYTVLIAENGEQGVVMAEKNNPDLIISDIMMPVMDGVTMCKALQEKKTTAHIPIILLTAKNSTKSKIEGLKSGAIEYLQKPFNFHELLLKVHNIIVAREKALSKYKIDLISAPKEDDKRSKDVIFMENLMAALNLQIENSEFKLEELSNNLHMSYAVIYRKFQEITGKTLVDFVRSLRLKRAAILIIKKGYNISEAAFVVGYKDSKYFTKCFKEEFGETPNFLKKEAQRIGTSDMLKKYNLVLDLSS